MNTARTTQVTALISALLLTVVVNGSVLLGFNDLAQQDSINQAGQVTVTLDTVTIVGSRS
jgi:hypothetical protein